MSNHPQRYFALPGRPLEVIDLSLIKSIDPIQTPSRGYIALNGVGGGECRVITVWSRKQEEETHAAITAALEAYRAAPAEQPTDETPRRHMRRTCGVPVEGYRVTEITVGAATSFNHPHESYANFKPSVTLTARVWGGNVDLTAAELQREAHLLVANEKARILAEIEREQEIENAKYALERANTALKSKHLDRAAAEKRILEIDTHLSLLSPDESRVNAESARANAVEILDVIRADIVEYEGRCASAIAKLKQLGAWPEEAVTSTPVPPAPEPAVAANPEAEAIAHAAEAVAAAEAPVAPDMPAPGEKVHADEVEPRESADTEIQGEHGPGI